MSELKNDAVDKEALLSTKRPILKITINKKYRDSCTTNLKQCKQYTPSSMKYNRAIDQTSHIDASNVKSNLTNHLQTIITSQNPVVFNIVPVIAQKCIKQKSTDMKVKREYSTPKTMYAKKGDLSRNSVRNLTSAERIRYLYTKAQRDCDILRIRLKALRERHRQEQEEIKQLQAHLSIFDSDIQDEYESEVSETQSKRRKTSLKVEDAEEEDEYEKLLRDVRKMKQDILNQREPYRASKKAFQKNVDNRSESYIEYEQVTTEDGETVGEVYEDCNEVVSKISDESDSELKPLNNEFKEQDYLEPVITDK